MTFYLVLVPSKFTGIEIFRNKGLGSEVEVLSYVYVPKDASFISQATSTNWVVTGVTGEGLILSTESGRFPFSIGHLDHHNFVSFELREEY